MAHILFWMVYIIYELIDQGWSNKDSMGIMDSMDSIVIQYTPQIWTDTLLTILIVYVNLYFLMPRYFRSRQYVRYTAGLFILMLAGGFLSRYLTYLIWIPWDKTHCPKDYAMEAKNFFIPLRILRNSIEFYPIVAVTMLLKIGNNSFKNEKRLREMEQEKFNAELNFLKAQIHPHFFFNTLNSLYALTLKKSERSPEMVLRLSDLMHYVLYETNAHFVPLATDIKHLKNYIGIEELRFGDRLELSFQYSGDIEGKLIAPLVLLPFVENAFKHGLRNETEKAWIIIDIKVSGNKLYFKAENSCGINTGELGKDLKGEIAHNGKGLGLVNVRRRLELNYPGKHELHIESGDAFFRVDLKLQLDEQN